MKARGMKDEGRGTIEEEMVFRPRERSEQSSIVQAKRSSYRDISFVVLSFVFCLLFPVSSNAASSVELIQQAARYDGAEVVFEGEVVGEVLGRGAFCWLNVRDGDNAIGIWTSRGLAAGILHAGSYKMKGDALRVHGIFHRACPEHGGGLDIHARTIERADAGGPVAEQLPVYKLTALAELLGILLCLLIISIWQKKRERR